MQQFIHNVLTTIIVVADLKFTGHNKFAFRINAVFCFAFDWICRTASLSLMFQCCPCINIQHKLQYCMFLFSTNIPFCFKTLNLENVLFQHVNQISVIACKSCGSFYHANEKHKEVLVLLKFVELMQLQITTRPPKSHYYLWSRKQCFNFYTSLINALGVARK